MFLFLFNKSYKKQLNACSQAYLNKMFAKSVQNLKAQLNLCSHAIMDNVGAIFYSYVDTYFQIKRYRD